MMQQRAPRPARLLISGFGPFPGVAVNASDGFAHVLAARAQRQFPDAAVHAATLPTDWYDATRLLTRILDHEQPDVCLHFGVSARAQGFVIETRARNRAAQAPDVKDMLPARPVLVPGAPASLSTRRVAATAAARLVADGLPGVLSKSAGTYLCNAVFYQSLLAAREAGGARAVLLVHLPDRIGAARRSTVSRPGAGRMSAAVAITGGLALIDVCLSHWRATTGTAVASANC